MFLVVKLLSLAAGGFLLFRKREGIGSFLRRQNFIIAALYGVLLSLIAVVYRLVVALNWIIQQGGIAR